MVSLQDRVEILLSKSQRLKVCIGSRSIGHVGIEVGV